MGEVTVGEKEIARVKGVERVGAANPVEGKVLKGVGTRFKEVPNDTCP